MLKNIKNSNHFYTYLTASGINIGDSLRMFLYHILLHVLIPQILIYHNKMSGKISSTLLRELLEDRKRALK